MTFNEFLQTKAAKSGRFKAIIKTLVDGRQMCLGVEPKNKRSRKYQTKYLFDKPIMLDELPHRKLEARQRARNIPTRNDGGSNLGVSNGNNPTSPDALAGAKASGEAGDPGRDGMPSIMADEGQAVGRRKGGTGGSDAAGADERCPECACGDPERVDDRSGDCHGTD